MVTRIPCREFVQGNFVLHSPVQESGNLTDKCLRVLAERHKAFEAERQRVLAEQETARQVQMAKERERAVAENARILEEKIQQDRAAMLKHYEEVNSHRLKEQQEQMQAGFTKQLDKLQKHITELENRPPAVIKRTGCNVM